MLDRNKKNLSGTSSFLNVFGKSNKAKILDFFIENNLVCYSIEEISNSVYVNCEYTKEITESFVKINILEECKFQGIVCYRLQINDLTMLLKILNNTITRFDADLNSELKELV